MSKFFHLNDYKVRLSAINFIGDVKSDANIFEFTFQMGSSDDIHYATYLSEAEAIAVHQKLIEALEDEG